MLGLTMNVLITIKRGKSHGYVQRRIGHTKQALLLLFRACSVVV